MQEGSAIGQVFSANAGDVITFDWNFLTDEFTNLDPPPELDFNDFAFVTTSTGTDVQSQVLADTFSTFVVSSSPLFGETGFNTFSFTVPTTDTYTLGIGVVNVGDIFLNSAVLVDNVQLSPIPEPTSLVTFSGLLGMGVIGQWRRRRKHSGK